MEPEKLMDGIAKELQSALRAMAKAKTVEEKLQYSAIVKNMSESLGVFLQMISDMVPYAYDPDDDE